jgi:exodeoxyribonuclease V gamma subunit
MIRVWYSNQLEELAGRLIANLKLGDSLSGFSLFAMPPIVVPNRNIETYLRYQIACGAGVAAGLNFYVPDGFQDELLMRREKEQPEPKRLHTAVLRAFLLDVLSDQTNVDQRAAALPDTVRAYLDSAGLDHNARDLHRFQLAGRLARLFHQYNEVRPGLLRDWSEDRAPFAGTAYAGTEEWQRALWDQLGALASRAGCDRGVRWTWPVNVLDVASERAAPFPPEVHVFGFSYLTHGYRELFRRLATGSQIELYTFSPVDWQTVDASNGTPIEKSTRRRGKGRVASVRIDRSDESIGIRWGRPGRDHFEELKRIGGANLETEFVNPEAATNLGRIQVEILGAGNEANEPFDPDDDSLVILACPGIRREAEIVSNEIWRLMREDDKGGHGRSPGRLRFPDIAVLVADTANLAVYQAHFRAVLEELYNIPFNMVDLPLAGESRLLEAVQLLLDLPLGEFTRPEVLKILLHPAVQARFPETDVEVWRSWALELEIVHGIDRDDHQGTYIEGEVFHWDQGLRRLVLGPFMTGPHTGDDRAFRLDHAEYLPFDVPAESVADVARLLLLVRSLAADIRFARTKSLTMSDWSRFFAAMLDAYIAADTDSEERVRAMCLHEIRRLAQLDVTGHKVGYRIAQASLREAIEGQTAARGYYLADGVVVSPLREMRALPFRVIFLCGLGEGRFPVRADLDPLDLAAADPRPGDVNPRDRDKYLFLETIACARERLYLSYVAKDAQTGDDLNPSPMLSELVRYLHRGHPRERDPAKVWVRNQPLRRFDSTYFDGERPARKPGSLSLSAAARGERQTLELCDEVRKAFAGSGQELPELSRSALRGVDPALASRLGLCLVDGQKSTGRGLRRLAVSLSDIRKFLECPLQGWARVMLRLREDDDEDESQRLDEHFVTGRMRESGLLRAVFLDALQDNCGGSSPDMFRSYYAKRAKLLAQQGFSPVGVFGDVEERRHLECLAGWHAFASETGLLAAGPFGVYRFGRAAESERVDRVGPAITLDMKLPDEAQPRRIELYGRTEIVSRALPGSLIPVVRTGVKEKDFLRGFLDAIVLSLEPGRHDPTDYHAHVIRLPAAGKSKNETARTFREIDAAKAREFLTTVLADLLGGPHEYLLPCEAVFNYLDPKNKKSITESVEDMKEDEHTSCSSRYGPVPDIERYDPPAEDEARAMIERRFGLFRSLGGSIE